mgnify:FL=1
MVYVCCVSFCIRMYSYEVKYVYRQSKNFCTVR